MNSTDTDCYGNSGTIQPDMIVNVLNTQPNSSLNNETRSLDLRINEISIFSLPKDALLLVCSPFSPKELVKLSCVSKNFNEMANYPEIWKSFCESVGVIRLEDFISLSEKDLTWKKLYFDISDDNKFFNKEKSLMLSIINNNNPHFNNVDLPVSIDYYSGQLKGINVKRISKIQLGLTYKIQEMSLIFCGKKIQDNDFINPIFLNKGKDCEFRITLKIAPVSQEKLENADRLDDDEEVNSKLFKIITLTSQEELEKAEITDDDDIAIEELDEVNSNSNIGFCITM